jgi:lysozyme
MKINHCVICSLVLIFFGCEKHSTKLKLLKPKGIFGIDVSHHQGIIDWPKVKKWRDKEISFVYIKATEGSTYQDKRYKQNFLEAKKTGFLVGSYHYFRTTSTPQHQFENFIKNINPEAQDLIPMIDLEENNNWSDKEYISNLKIFLHLIENHFGSKPLLYSVQGFYNTYIQNEFNSYHWNIARYNVKQPHLLDKNRWSIWQFSDKGRINGINKNVDLNQIRHNLNLDMLLKKT